MKFILNVISLLAVGSVAASQQEVQHRLRGGVDSSDMEDTAASSGDCASITDTVCAMEGVTVFCDLLQNPMETDAFGIEDASEEFTLFVPTDAAFAIIADTFETLSDAEAGRVIMFHMYSGMMLTSDKLACSETITSMNEMSDASRTKCNKNGDGKKYQNGNGNTKTGSMPEIDTADHLACNGVIHTLDHVMFPVSLAQLHADDAVASSDPTTTGATDTTAADAEVIQTGLPTSDGNETSSQEYSSDGDGDAEDMNAVDITLPPTVDVGASLSKGTVADAPQTDLGRINMCPSNVFPTGSPACNYQETPTSPVMDKACICTEADSGIMCQIQSAQDDYC